MSGYYDDLRSHPDDSRVVGWESRLAQLTRFELVRHLLGRRESLLDLGAGLGDLGRYVAATHSDVAYHGVEARPEVVARARAKRPSVVLTCGNAFGDEPDNEADVVAVIGALVDGSSLRNPAERFKRARQVIASAMRQARRLVILVFARQDLLDNDPLRSLDPALGGVALGELPWLVPPGTTLGRVDGLLPNDLALVLARAPHALPELPPAAVLRAQALAHPHAALVPLPERIRFHLEVGEFDTARALITVHEKSPDHAPNAAWRLLRDRLALEER